MQTRAFTAGSLLCVAWWLSGVAGCDPAGDTVDAGTPDAADAQPVADGADAGSDAGADPGPGDPGGGDPGSGDPGAGDLGAGDPATGDSEPGDPGGGDRTDGTDAGGDPGPGSRLVIEQLYLSGFAMGEAALVIGPDGTSVLIDVGNDSHADEVLAAVERRLGAPRVDWVVLTHYHADHIGGIEDVLAGLEVAGGIVTRGLVDVGDTVGEDDFQQMCTLLRDPIWQERHIPLCAGIARAPCDGDEAGMPWPADGCGGLLLSDLADPADDQTGQLAHIELGAGARLWLWHADAHMALESGVVSAEDEGVAVGHGGTAPENARSLGGVIRWGDFAYSFDGDLTGAGDSDVPDLEGFYAARADRIRQAPLPAGGLDVAKLSHHGLHSATQQGWVAWMVPDDGQDRNAVVGTNHIYWRSPAQEVLDRLAPRLGAGFVWVTELGLMPGSHDRMIVSDGPVVIEVRDAGASYSVTAADGRLEHYTSTAP